ncbi:MAG: hypothetical protein WBC44_18200, partial [Planctomycetaceae bacterium]
HPDRDEMWCVVAIEGYSWRDLSESTWTTQTDPDRRMLAFHSDGRIIDLLAFEPPAWWDQPESVLLAKVQPAGTPLRYVVPNVVDQLSALRHSLSLAREDRLPANRILVSGYYQVTNIALARWDGRGSPLSMLASLKTVLSYPRAVTWDVLRPLGTHGEFTGRTGPQLTTPPAPKAVPSTWTIPLPEALLHPNMQWDESTVFGQPTLAFCPGVIGREPVEAPRPE